MARRQAAGRFRLLVDLGLPRRGRHPGLVRHLRSRSGDADRPRAGTRAERLGGRGRRRRGRAHQGRRRTGRTPSSRCTRSRDTSPPTTPSRRSSSTASPGSCCHAASSPCGCRRGTTSTPSLSVSTNSAARSTGSARWCTACSTSSSTNTSRRCRPSTMASRLSRTTCSRTTLHVVGCSARHFGCARTSSSCDGWCLPMREVVNVDPAPQARRQDRAGARPAVRRPVRPRAAGVGVDGIAAGHGHHGVRDEPVAAGCPVEHGDEEAHRMGGDHRGADGDHRVLRAERRTTPASRRSAASSPARR